MWSNNTTVGPTYVHDAVLIVTWLSSLNEEIFFIIVVGPCQNRGSTIKNSKAGENAFSEKNAFRGQNGLIIRPKPDVCPAFPASAVKY